MCAALAPSFHPTSSQRFFIFFSFSGLTAAAHAPHLNHLPFLPFIPSLAFYHGFNCWSSVKSYRLRTHSLSLVLKSTESANWMSSRGWIWMAIVAATSPHSPLIMSAMCAIENNSTTKAKFAAAPRRCQINRGI